MINIFSYKFKKILDRAVYFIFLQYGFVEKHSLNGLRFKIMFFLVIFWLQNSILIFFFLSDNHGSVDTSLRFSDKIVQT